MEFLFLLLCLLIIVVIWQKSMRARETAILHCARICKNLNLQLLDQTIALRAIHLADWQRFPPVMNKKYTFEFSINGSDRYKGYILLQADRVNLVGLEHPAGNLILQQDEIYKMH